MRQLLPMTVRLTPLVLIPSQEGFRLAAFALGMGFCLPIAAAADPVAMQVQVASTSELAPLSDQNTVTLSAATASAGQIYQPAPMPNPDAEPPHDGDAAPSRATLAPALFSHKAEFQGDGYSAASSVDHGLDERRTPAAGLNWSVPVK